MIITPPVPGPSIEVSTPAAAAAELIGRSKFTCGMAILAQAPDHKQRNAALGILDPAETAAIVAHIAACRATQQAFEDSVLAVLANAGLDDAGKMTALEALA